MYFIGEQEKNSIKVQYSVTDADYEIVSMYHDKNELFGTT